MGNPAAPSIATLYVAYFERIMLNSSFNDQLLLYVRYLDDVLVILKDNNNFQKERAIAFLKRTKGLEWTIEDNGGKEINFLDLHIKLLDYSFSTRTQEKELSLHLYLPPYSAHPPGVISGMIAGFVKRYKKQNSDPADVVRLCVLLASRLIARGHNRRRIFSQIAFWLNQEGPLAITTASSKDAGVSCCPKKLFFHTRFSRSGPSRKQLRAILLLDELEALIPDTRVCLAFSRSKNLLEMHGGFKLNTR